MTKSNEHLHVCFELDFQNKTVVFSSVLAKKQQKKGSNLYNSFGMKNLELYARVFFFTKVSRMFTQCKSFTKERVFLCLMQVAPLFLNHEPFAKEVGTVLRTEAEIFS